MPTLSARSREWYIAGDKRLESRRVSGLYPNRPTIVMLHEGLGSVSQWADFPERIAHETGCDVFVYSRYGYGQSDLLEEPRDISYMHNEAQVVLPELLGKASISRPILFGQSDGASIALLHAAKFCEDVAGLILEAPHVFVEDLTIDSIARAKVLYETTDFPRKLARHHKDADRTFWGWNKIWLDPRFRSWNIESYLDSIRCPVLVIQGQDDEYGTVKQLEAIQTRIPSAKIALWPQCKHAPHRDQPEATLQSIVTFVNALK